jgi:hypothetical protein
VCHDRLVVSPGGVNSDLCVVPFHNRIVSAGGVTDCCCACHLCCQSWLQKVFALAKCSDTHHHCGEGH